MAIQANFGWLPIERGEFWDVPRVFVVKLRTTGLLFDAPFEEESDEYSSTYAIYLIPRDLVPPWPSWTEVVRQRTPVGRVPVADVRFDPTRREFVWSEDVVAAVPQFQADIDELVRLNRGTTPPSEPPPPASPYT